MSGEEMEFEQEDPGPRSGQEIPRVAPNRSPVTTTVDLDDPSLEWGHWLARARAGEAITLMRGGCVLGRLETAPEESSRSSLIAAALSSIRAGDGPRLPVGVSLRELIDEGRG